MQKIHKQDLGNSEEIANSKAIYTWQKDEIAYLYNSILNEVYKIKFTGNRWLIGNRWSRDKIYEYKIIEYYTSPPRNNQIIHDSEESFYTTREEVLKLAQRILENKKNWALKEYKENLEKIKQIK